MTASVTAGIATLSGDPEAILAAGRKWRMAGMACAAAAAQVSSASDISTFRGDEAVT